MKWASSRISADAKFSSSEQRGISAWIWLANPLASPRYSRCARRWDNVGGALGMAAPLCRIHAARGSRRGDSAGALAPRLYSACERVEQRHRSLPPKAGIGDALPELERLARLEVLAAFNEVRLHHHPDDAPFARADLAGDVAR